MKKTLIKNSEKMSITFEMPAEIEGKTLSLVGDFNNWDGNKTQMKRRKDGTWAFTLRLVPGTYRYRYLADNAIWHNDWDADAYEPSGVGEDNSVVIVE
jgi:1,4-alpha-glucan branching enzyme